MKQVLKKNNIKTANYILINNDNKFTNKTIQSLKYPLVVKPADCNSSKGVVKVNDYSFLKIAIKEALQLSRSNKAIVEEYIDGVEISVDAWADNNDVAILSITREFFILNRASSLIVFNKSDSF